METIASVPQYATLEAVVYPVCVCGRSYPDHETEIDLCKCRVYRPSRPIEDHGVIWKREVK